MQIALTDFRAVRLAAIRHVGPYHEIGAAFGRLMGWAHDAGILDGSSHCLAIYHDDPKQTPARELRSDACLIVVETIAIEGEAHEERLPAGRFARTTTIGHYSGLGQAWSDFGDQILAQGYRYAPGPVFEIYINDHDSVAPEQLATDLYCPVER